MTEQPKESPNRQTTLRIMEMNPEHSVLDRYWLIELRAQQYEKSGYVGEGCVLRCRRLSRFVVEFTVEPGGEENSEEKC